MSNHPLVSCIVPVYNGALYLTEAIESVLAQTYRPLELIVVDDGSTDASAAVATSFEDVRYLSQSHAGLGAALNNGLAAARGEYVSFLDADDLWLPDKLAQQMRAFESDPQLDLVFGHFVPFVSGEEDACPTPAGISPGYFKGTMLAKKEVFARVGPFETRWQLGDFIEWYLRAQECGMKTLMLPDVMLRRRIHPENMGVRERERQVDYVHILKRALDRRRSSEE